MAKPNFTNEYSFVSSTIRVNHAGEYGAKRIYEGQIDYCKDSRARNIIEHMMQQEEVHLNYFTNLLLERNIRPTILAPIWHVIGYAIGACSIILGAKTAMLLTQSVEEVIENHYQDQIDILANNPRESLLLKKIQQFQLDEIEHKDIAIIEGSREVRFSSIIKKALKFICKISITLSKKI